MAGKTWTYRISSEGVDKIVAELAKVGIEGDKVFKALEGAAPSLANALNKAKEAADRKADGLRKVRDQAGPLNAAMGEIGNAAQGLAARLGLVGNMLATIGPLGIGAGAAMAGLGLGITATARAGDQLALLEGRLKIVTGSTEAAREAIAGLRSSAQSLGVSFTESAETFARFARAGADLGRSRGEMLAFAETVQKLAAIGGSSAQEAASGAQQLAQALASGRLQGDELRSILENMPELARALASGLGVSVGQLRELGAAGALSAEKVVAAVLKGKEDADRQFAILPDTVARGVARLGNAYENMVQSIERRIESSTLVKALLFFGTDSLNAAARTIDPGSTASRLEQRLRELEQLRTPSGRAGFAGGQAGYEAEIRRLEEEIGALQARRRREMEQADGPDIERARQAAEQRRRQEELFGITLDGTVQKYREELDLLRQGNEARAVAQAREKARADVLKQAGVEDVYALSPERQARVLAAVEAAENLAEAQVRAEAQTRKTADALQYQQQVERERAEEINREVERIGRRVEEEARLRQAFDASRVEIEQSIGTMNAQADALLAGEAASERYARSVAVSTAEQKAFQTLMKSAPDEIDAYSAALVLAAERAREAGQAAGRLFDAKKVAEETREAQRDLERQAEEAAKLWSKPFENALEGIQRGFADAFTSIFDGGVNSFKDLAATVKGVFTRLAGEIAALLIFRPVVGSVLGGLGLGGLAGQMGLGGATAGTLGGQMSGGLSGGGGIGNLLGRVPGVSPNGFGGFSFDPTMSWVGSIFGGGGATPAMGAELGALGIGTGAEVAGLAAPGMGLGGLLSIGGGILSIGLPLLQGNYGGAAGGLIGGGIGALFGPAGFGIGAALGSMLGGLFGFGKKKTIPRATAFYGPEAGDYGFLSSETRGKGAPIDVTRAGGNYAADLLNAFTTDSGLAIDDPTLGFYLRGKSVKGGGRAFGGLFDPVAGQIVREWTSSESGDFERVAQSVALFTLKEAVDRGVVVGDARQTEALKRSLAGPDGSFEKVLNNQGDLGETLEGVLGDVKFARDFDFMIKSLKDGVLDFSGAVGIQATEEVRNATRAVQEFKEKTEELGLPVEEAAAATKEFVEVLLGIRERAEPMSDVAKLWEALNAKFAAAGPLLEEVGIEVARLPELLAEAQARVRAEFDDGIEEQIRGITDPFGLAMERLREAQEQQLADATLIGGNIVELERLHLLQRQELVEQATGGAISGIRQYLQQLDQGGLSPLSPAARLSEAGYAFNQAVNAARGGDLAALSQLTSLSTPYLTAAQSYYGGNEQYAAIYEAVRGALSSTAGRYETGDLVADAVTTGAQATVNQLVSIEDELRRARIANAEQAAELAGLRADLSRFFAQAGAYR